MIDDQRQQISDTISATVPQRSKNDKLTGRLHNHNEIYELVGER